MKKIIKRYILIAATLSIAGCGIWTNFTTYFNRYYNTKQAFEEGMEVLGEQERELFAFKEVNLPSKANSSFKKVIEKGSKILQFNNESSYVDDALMMTGQAFYYQKDYAKALRKFQELAAIPETDLALENKLWIAKCNLQLRSFESGLSMIEDVKKEASETEDNEILIKAYVVHISYLKYIERYTSAVTLCDELLNVSDDGELNAEITYEMGKMYLEIDDLAKAAESFENVQNYDPDYVIDFNSQIELARIKKEMGKVNESLDLLKTLRSKNKFADFWDVVGLEIGLIYYEQEKIDDAYFEFTVVDTTYKKTESAGICAFMRAEIWEKYYHDVDSAMLYYDRALASQAPKKYKFQARKKSKIYSDFLGLKEDQEKYEIQLVYVLEPDQFLQDSLDYEIKMKARDSLLIGDNPPPRGGGGQGRQNNPDRDGANPQNAQDEILIKPLRPKLSADSLVALVADTKFKIANLFFSDLEIGDSAFVYYTDIIDNYPPDKNRPQILFALGSYYLTKNDSVKADSLFQYVYDNFEGHPAAIEAGLKLGLAVSEYEKDPAQDVYIAMENELENKNYQVAAEGFASIYLEHPASLFAPQGLYTAGWIYENLLFYQDKAAQMYDTLTTKYRSAEYSRAVLAKLNIYKREIKRVQDSIAAAEKAIEDSITALQNAAVDSSDSVDSLKNIPVEPEKADTTQLKPEIEQKDEEPDGGNLGNFLSGNLFLNAPDPFAVLQKSRYASYLRN